MMTESEGLCCKQGFFSYCSEVDARNKVVIIKIVASNLLCFLPVANDETGHPPVPFDITPFSLTPQ